MTACLSTDFNIARYRPQGWTEGFFTSDTGHRLRYAHAEATGEHRGTIVLTHGYGEFSDLYYNVIREYQNMGFDVWAMDHYGFGKSKRDDNTHPYDYTPEEMRHHVADLDYFARNIVRRDLNKPLILSTHSMGGHIGLMELEDHPGVFDGAVMSSPMFDIYRLGLPPSFKPLIQGIFNAASRIGLENTPIPGHLLWLKPGEKEPAPEQPGVCEFRVSFDNAVRNEMKDSAVKRPTFGWMASALETIKGSMDPGKLSVIKTPVLIGSAGQENLVDVEAHHTADRLIPDSTLISLPQASHALWFQPDPEYKMWLEEVTRFTDRIVREFDPHADRPAAYASARKPSPVPAPQTGGFGIPIPLPA